MRSIVISRFTARTPKYAAFRPFRITNIGNIFVKGNVQRGFFSSFYVRTFFLTAIVQLLYHKYMHMNFVEKKASLEYQIDSLAGANVA